MFKMTQHLMTQNTAFKENRNTQLKCVNQSTESHRLNICDD